MFENLRGTRGVRNDLRTRKAPGGAEKRRVSKLFG
jgi:hypothetical protein